MSGEFGEGEDQAKIFDVTFPKTDDKVQKKLGKGVLFSVLKDYGLRSLVECSLRRTWFHVALGGSGIF